MGSRGNRLLISDGDNLYVLDAKRGDTRVVIALASSAGGEKTEPFQSGPRMGGRSSSISSTRTATPKSGW